MCFHIFWNFFQDTGFSYFWNILYNSFCLNFLSPRADAIKLISHLPCRCANRVKKSSPKYYKSWWIALMVNSGIWKIKYSQWMTNALPLQNAVLDQALKRSWIDFQERPKYFQNFFRVPMQFFSKIIRNFQQFFINFSKICLKNFIKFPAKYFFCKFVRSVFFIFSQLFRDFFVVFF